MDGEKHIKEAYAAILQQDYEQAIASFTEAISLEPDNAAYHYKISITYARSNKLALAIKHAGKASALDPTQKQYADHLQNLLARELMTQAEEYFEQESEQLHLAEALLTKAVSLDPLTEEGYLLLAAARAGLGEYAYAVQALKDLLMLNPHHQIGTQLLKEYTQKLQQYFQKNTNESS